MTAQTDLFDSILSDVYALTVRPDLEAETELAVRTATLSAHSSAAYPRDSVLVSIQLPSAVSVFLSAVDIQVSLPRFRGLSSVQLLDSTFAPVSLPEIEIVEMGDIRDPIYHQIRNDIAYVAGTSLNIRSSIPAYGYSVEYFQSPLVRREHYNSWIAQLAPDIIIYQAAAIVLGTNGNEEKSRNYMNMVNTVFKPLLDQNYLTGAMR
jgi:hypothetical protein